MPPRSIEFTSLLGIIDWNAVESCADNAVSFLPSLTSPVVAVDRRVVIHVTGIHPYGWQTAMAASGLRDLRISVINSQKLGNQ